MHAHVPYFSEATAGPRADLSAGLAQLTDNPLKFPSLSKII